MFTGAGLKMAEARYHPGRLVVSRPAPETVAFLGGLGGAPPVKAIGRQVFGTPLLRGTELTISCKSRVRGAGNARFPGLSPTEIPNGRRISRVPPPSSSDS